MNFYQKNNLIKPNYGRGSIAEIAPSVLNLFGVSTKRGTLPFLKKENGKYRQVILLIVDAFGYDQFKKYQKNLPIIKKMVKDGEVQKITSVFPTTTAAALTAIHTGLTPQEHGLPEWVVYFEEFGQIIETLPFRPVKTTGTDTMLKFGGRSEMLYAGPTVFQALKAGGVKPFLFTSKRFTNSAYTRAVTKGGNVIGFANLTDLMKKLRTAVTKEKSRAFFSVYWGEVDNALHHHGPNSLQHQKALRQFFQELQKELINKINTKLFSDTLMIICADHGQVKVNPKKTIYLNNYPEIIKNLAKSKQGKIIPPTGSPRDVFLFVQPKKVKETIKLLKKQLGNKADIFEIAKLKKEKWFGINAPTKKFNRRVGNLLILPRKNYAVWYIHVPGELLKFLGIHGGATAKEMLVPFGFIPMSKL
ncbi:MAG: alkaline phosphatase family protein [Patescibacteria group bacterium]|jgi:predicted AlkP superfamily pyrophosphatase or phosphodiesterase